MAQETPTTTTAAPPAVPAATTTTTATADVGLEIGQRVADAEGNIATVHYIGPVFISKNPNRIYAGLEWDDHSRGKHDGEVSKKGQTVRYFTAPAGSGSFMKPELLNKGTSFLAALLDKYEGARLDSSDVGSVATSSGGEVAVEFVGEDLVRAQQRLKRNPNVSLRGLNVSSIETAGIGEVAPNIVELDMRDNLLWKWDDISALPQQLPRLSVLNLGNNRMKLPSAAEVALFQSSCMTLQVLILSATQLAWPAVAALCSELPALEELHMTQNNLSSLATDSDADAKAAEDGGDLPAVTGFKALRVLNLAQNAFTSWAQIARLSQLPSLQQLLLHDNQLTSVAYPSPASAGSAAPAAAAGAGAGAGTGTATDTASFPALKLLALNDNCITSWSSVDELNKFPALTGLRLVRNPVVAAMGPSPARQAIVARVAKLSHLNNSEVRARERTDAEKLYLRHVAAEVKESENIDLFAAANAMNEAEGDASAATAAAIAAVPAAIGALHPRFVALLQMHGPEMLQATQAGGPSSMGSSTITVKLISMAAASCTTAPVSKKLPSSMTVAMLKRLFHKLFDCDVALQRLAFKSSGGYMPTPLDDDLKPLSYFGVGDKAEVIMEEIDPRAAARAKAESEAAKEAKLSEQMAHVAVAQKYQEADVRQRQQAAATGT